MNISGQLHIPTSNTPSITNYLNKSSLYNAMGSSTIDNNSSNPTTSLISINSQKSGPVRATYEAIIERPKSSNM